MPRTYSDDELRDAIASSMSWSEVGRKLGDVSRGRYACTVAEQLGLDTTHFVGQAVNRGRRFATWTPDDVLVLGTRHDKRVSRRLLVAYDYKEDKCEDCGITEWRGQRAPLELEHVNGNNADNRIENLKLLCCNCHALTPTWRRQKRQAQPRRSRAK